MTKKAWIGVGCLVAILALLNAWLGVSYKREITKNQTLTEKVTSLETRLQKRTVTERTTNSRTGVSTERIVDDSLSTAAFHDADREATSSIHETVTKKGPSRFLGATREVKANEYSGMAGIKVFGPFWGVVESNVHGDIKAGLLLFF